MFVALATVSTVSAFTFQSTFVRGTSGSISSRALPRTTPSSGQMRMFFGNLFASNNPFGAIKKIDYSILDHPGPELAAMAESGLAPAESTRDPHFENSSKSTAARSAAMKIASPA